MLSEDVEIRKMKYSNTLEIFELQEHPKVCFKKCQANKSFWSHSKWAQKYENS